MNEVLQFLKENAHYFTLAFSAILDLIVLIYAKVKGQAVKKLLLQAKQRGTYIQCPHCRKPVQLEDVTFFLPGGLVDSNLNGVPDEKE